MFAFCTGIWDFSGEPEYTLTINTYLFDGLIYFENYLNYEDYWYSFVSNTEADSMNEQLSTTCKIQFGCYFTIFESQINFWEDVGFWYELVANENVTIISRGESEDDD